MTESVTLELGHSDSGYSSRYTSPQESGQVSAGLEDLLSVAERARTAELRGVPVLEAVVGSFGDGEWTCLLVTWPAGADTPLAWRSIMSGRSHVPTYTPLVGIT